MKIFKKIKSIHHYKTVISIAFLILLLTGIIPSLISCDWTWLSRSGALLVIFGIFIVWLDYESRINKDLDSVFSGFRDYLNDSDKNLSTKEVDNIKEEIQGKFNEVSDATKKRFQNIEFFIVAIGTLIWGYGDLVNKIDFKPSSSIKQIKQIEHNKTLERNDINVSR